MNINELFQRINLTINQIKDDMPTEPDRGKQIYMQGLADGLSQCEKLVNEVNMGAGEIGQALRYCLGWGHRHGACEEKVPRKFLQLYCDVCNQRRLAESNRPVYGGFVQEDERECVILEFPKVGEK